MVEFDKKYISKRMEMWRTGMEIFPDEYITLHKNFAYENLPALLKKFDCRLIKDEMINDGWYEDA